MHHPRSSVCLASLLLLASIPRTLVAAETAAPASWADCAIGTNFDVRIEHVTQLLFPPGRKPTTDTGAEHWTLVRKDPKTAVFAVVVGDKKLENTLPLVPEPLAEEGASATGPDDHQKTGMTHETIETPLGKLDCAVLNRQHTMNEASGEEQEWRAAAYPLPVKTRSHWTHKQQEDTETRTVVRFERAK